MLNRKILILRKSFICTTVGILYNHQDSVILGGTRRQKSKIWQSTIPCSSHKVHQHIMSQKFSVKRCTKETVYRNFGADSNPTVCCSSSTKFDPRPNLDYGSSLMPLRNHRPETDWLDNHGDLTNQHILYRCLFLTSCPCMILRADHCTCSRFLAKHFKTQTSHQLDKDHLFQYQFTAVSCNAHHYRFTITG